MPHGANHGACSKSLPCAPKTNATPCVNYTSIQENFKEGSTGLTLSLQAYLFPHVGPRRTKAVLSERLYHTHMQTRPTTAINHYYTREKENGFIRELFLQLAGGPKRRLLADLLINKV